MKHGERTLLCALASLALCTAAGAVTEDTPANPYQGIVDRNVFALKDPPPATDPAANKTPPPRILLQGITTILGNKRALFKVQLPPRPGDPAKGEQSYIMAEGQRDGEIEVLEINTDAGSVKVNNYGTITNLNFADNGIKPPTAPAPAPGPAPGLPGFVPAPGANPAALPGGAPSFTRPMRPFTTGGAAAAVAPGAVAPAYAGGVSLPGFSTASSAASQPQQDTGPALSYEARVALIEAQRQRYKDQGSPLANLLPPLAATRALTPGASGSSSGTATPRPLTPPRPPTLPLVPP
jgi:hypothetical protein